MTIAKKLGALTLAFAAVSTSGCSSDTDYVFMMEMYGAAVLGTVLLPFTYNNLNDGPDCRPPSPAVSLPECKNQNNQAPAKSEMTAPQPKR